MTKFTQEDLIQFMYNETSIQKTAAIKAALETDWDLKESFELLSGTQKNLREIKLSSPREEVINKILQHTTKKQGQLYPH